MRSNIIQNMPEKTEAELQEKIDQVLELHYEKIQELLAQEQLVVIAHNPGSQSTEMLRKIGWQGERLLALTDVQRQKLTQMCGREGGRRVRLWFKTKRGGSLLLFLEEQKFLLDCFPCLPKGLEKHASVYDEINRALNPHIREIKKLSSKGDLVIFPHRLEPWSEALLRQLGWKGEAFFCLSDDVSQRFAQDWADNAVLASWFAVKRPGRVLAFSGDGAQMLELSSAGDGQQARLSTCLGHGRQPH